MEGLEKKIEEIGGEIWFTIKWLRLGIDKGMTYEEAIQELARQFDEDPATIQAFVEKTRKEAIARVEFRRRFPKRSST